MLLGMLRVIAPALVSATALCLGIECLAAQTSGNLSIQVTVTATGMSPPAGYASAQLIFDDTFSSPLLDTTKWNNCLGDDHYGCWRDNGNLPAPYSALNANTTNGEAYYYPYPAGYSTNLSGNHLVTGSGLRTIATVNNYFASLGYVWASSAITSFGHFYLPGNTGGYVQWRTKFPDCTHGAWMALWFLPRGTGSGGAEMDLNECGYLPAGGASNANYMLATHWHGANGNQVVINTGKDLSVDYHIYGIEYNPNHWWKVYLDGVLMQTWSGAIGNDDYELIMDFEFAGSGASGYHTVFDTTNFPGPYEGDISEVQMYSLH
jgi:hypothetical protein